MVKKIIKKNVMQYKKKAQIVGQKILMELIKLKFGKPLRTH